MANKTQNELNTKQLQCIELLVYEALSQRDAAARLGIHERTISKWKKEPKFMDELISRRRGIYSAYAPKAVQKIVYLMGQADNENVQLQAAKDILDRAGDCGKSNIDVAVSGAMSIVNPFEGLTTEELRRLASIDEK